MRREGQNMQKGWCVCAKPKPCISSTCHGAAAVWCVGLGIHHDTSRAADKVWIVFACVIA